MFSNNRKTIGLFIGRTGHFQNIMCENIINKAKEYGYNVAIFSAFGEFGGNQGFSNGEVEIINLPNYKKLDGIIIAPDTLDITGMDEKLIDVIKERSRCPVVSLRKEVEGFYNIMTDDNFVMESIIRHFIVEHKFERICFMSGPKGFIDGDRRLHCFLRLMKEHGLPVGENQIFYGNFWKGMAKQACDHFFGDERFTPQAIICANDYMAVDICNELGNRNIRIPEDVAVCGYDGIRETDLYIPTISTVEVPFEEMGRKSVEIIHNALLGKPQEKKVYVQTRDHYKETCGCRQFDMEKQSRDQKEFFERMELVRDNSMQSTFMSIDLEEITEFEQLSDVVIKYVFNNLGFESFYMFMCDEEEMCGKPYSQWKTFTSNMKLKMGIRNEVVVGESDHVFPREELLPSELTREEPMVFFFLPLHYNEHCFGYTAISFHGGRSYNEFYEPFMVNIGNALEAIHIRKEMRRLLWEMEEMNVKDFLTGLLNRRGLEKYSQFFLQKANEEGQNLFVLGLDLDGMKIINDQHGHEEGDNALRVVAQGLKEAAIRGELCARVGGDEFNVVGIDYTKEMAEGFVERFLEYVNHYNDTSGKPYKIVSSYGIYITSGREEKTLQDLMRISDDRMYRQKNAKRRKGIIR